MNTDQFCTRLILVIDSVWTHDPPKCNILIDDQLMFSGQINQQTTIDHQWQLSRGTHCLTICYTDKSPTDPTQAIVISSLAFNGIVDKRFVWTGQYRPEYPEPWATEQRHQGTELVGVLHNTDYLGWAGTWKLEFTAPVFTWMHQIKNLGTIYD